MQWIMISSYFLFKNYLIKFCLINRIETKFMLDDGELSIVQAMRRENMELIAKNRRYEMEIINLRVLKL